MKIASNSRRSLHLLACLTLGIGAAAISLDAIAGLPIYEGQSKNCKTTYWERQGQSSPCKNLPVTGSVNAARDCITAPVGAVNTSNSGKATKVVTWDEAGEGAYDWDSPIPDPNADPPGADCKPNRSQCDYVCRSSTLAEVAAAELERADQLYLYEDGQAALIGSDSEQEVSEAANALMGIVKSLPIGERFGVEEQQAVLSELSTLSGPSGPVENIALTLASSALVQDDFADAFPESTDGNQIPTIIGWVVIGIVLFGLGFFFFRKRTG